jgi:signal transduction histidine kinase
MQRLLASNIHSCIVVPLFIEDKLIGELKLASTRIAAFDQEAEEIASEVSAQLALAIQKARLFEQNQLDRKRLQTLSTRLMEAQETERRHIARELHDEIGQALTAVKINLQTLKRSADTLSQSSSSTEIVSPIQDSADIVEVALQQVRNLSLDLRPSLLDDLGLVAALRWYVDRFTKRTGIKTNFLANSYQAQLDPKIETACFRIVQEALTNVMRYAQGQQVTVELRQQDEVLHLLISDDGVGFDVQAARERATQGGSLGLLGMEERALLVNGQFRIHSTPTEGTKIDVSFPIAAQTQKFDDFKIAIG